MKIEKLLGLILTIILIISGLLALGGYNTIKDFFNNFNKDNSIPFTIKLSPEYFNEGNYDYKDEIPFSIEIDKKYGRNITYLELPKESFKVSRKDEGLNKPVSQVNWEDSRSNKVITFGNLNSPYNYYSYSSFPFKAEGEMFICKNCFIGTEYPYVFTFTIYYKEDGKELKSETFNEIISIK